MSTLKREKGFTLVEVMIVLVIIGVVLTFLIPRAYRASVESKYQLLRQTCTELASWANEWGEKELEIQPTEATSNLSNYMDTLGNDGAVVWVADSGGGSNWQSDTLEDVAGRTTATSGGADTSPNTGVKEIMPQAKILTNPFNGLSVFSNGNDPAGVGNAVTGAIGCAWVDDVDNSFTPPETYHYYALIFQGTESTGAAAFYAGQDDGSLAGLRNGIFIARLHP